jgi:hypothetical protein
MALKKLIDQIHEVYEQEGNGEARILEFHWDKEQNVGTLSGNKAGLLLFARELVTLATSNARGAHAHFDDASIFPSGSDALIIERADL